MKAHSIFLLAILCLVKPCLGQILSCVDPDELIQARNYIFNNTIDGMIEQLNLLGNDKEIKNGPTILEASQRNLINEFFIDSNSYFFGTFGKIERSNPKILDVLKDMYILHKSDSVKFNLSDKECKAELYYENGQKGLKPFMYMVLTGVLTIEVTNAKTNYHKTDSDTLAFFYKIPIYSSPESDYYASLNLENVKVWQVINRNLFRQINNIVRTCDGNEDAAIVNGSESETFQLQAFAPMEFKTNPPEAAVKIIGFPADIISPIVTDSFLVGTYKVKISKKGYYSKDTSITIYPNHKNKIFINLNPKQGKIQIKCSQNPDMIVIDGGKQQPYYATPYVLTTGTHKIQLYKKYYNDTLIEIEIEPDKLITQSVDLSNKKGYLTISNIDGSAINSRFTIEGSNYIDLNFPQDKTGGFTLQVNQGFVVVKFVKRPWNGQCNSYQEGFVTFSDTILVDSELPQKLDVKLIPYFTTILETDPLKRSIIVYIDGVQMTCPPGSYFPITAGSHSFKFEDNGIPYDFAYPVKKNENRITFDLRKHKVK